MSDQTTRLLKAKIALSLANHLKRRPTDTEIEKFTLAGLVLYESIIGAYHANKRIEKGSQTTLF